MRRQLSCRACSAVRKVYNLALAARTQAWACQETGSVHILDLTDPATARAFAFDEPNHQAGVYRDVLLRRWRNLLGRTMWDFPGGPAAGLDAPPDSDDLIAYGSLLSDDGSVWLGTAALVRARTARGILTRGWYADVEVHAWESAGGGDGRRAAGHRLTGRGLGPTPVP